MAAALVAHQAADLFLTSSPEASPVARTLTPTSELRHRLSSSFAAFQAPLRREVRPAYTHMHTESKPLFDSPAAAIEAPVSVSLVPVSAWTPPLRFPQKTQTLSQRAELLQQAAEDNAPRVAEGAKVIGSLKAEVSDMALSSEDQPKPPAWDIHPDYALPLQFQKKGSLNERANRLHKAAAKTAAAISDRREVLESRKARVGRSNSVSQTACVALSSSAPTLSCGFTSQRSPGPVSQRPGSAPYTKPAAPATRSTSASSLSRPASAAQPKRFGPPALSRVATNSTRPVSAAQLRRAKLGGQTSVQVASKMEARQPPPASSLILSWPHADVGPGTCSNPVFAH